MGKTRPDRLPVLQKSEARYGAIRRGGSCMNLALSVIGGFLYCLCLALMRIPLFSISVLPFSFMIRLLAQFFYLFHILNLSLAVFNLLPIPPFDGSRVLFAFLPDKYYFGIMRYERYIQIVLLVLIYFGFADGFLSAVTAPLSDLILRLFKLLFRIPLS